jgi:hypothetical protein
MQFAQAQQERAFKRHAQLSTEGGGRAGGKTGTTNNVNDKNGVDADDDQDDLDFGVADDF